MKRAIFPKTHVQRLRTIVRRMVDKEREMQAKYGDPAPGTMRAGDLRDLHALREILWRIDSAELEAA